MLLVMMWHKVGMVTLGQTEKQYLTTSDIILLIQIMVKALIYNCNFDVWQNEKQYLTTNVIILLI